MSWVNRVSDWFRRRSPRKASTEGPIVLPSKPPDGFASIQYPLAERWVQHPGHGLTNRRIVQIFAAAEAGFPAEQCDLFDDIIETDAHLRSQLESRLDGVAGKPWIVQAGGDGAADRLAAERLDAALRDVPNFTETLQHQLKANWYGYAFSEIYWEQAADGWIVPILFANTPARRFRFDDRDRPRLIVKDGDVEGSELAPGKWICGRRSGRPIARTGLMRTATWWSLFKRLAVRDWVVFAERFGIPYVTGSYNDQASPEDKAVLSTAIKSLGKDGQAMFSEMCKIVIHEVQSGGKTTDVHGAITTLCNNEISKLISGATLTSETSGPGSYALGNVHANRLFELKVGDAHVFGERFQQELGRPFCHYNGLAARAPRLVLQVTPEYDPKTRAQVLSILANEVGLELDEEQVRTEFQVKRPGPGGALRGSRAGAAPVADPPTSTPE